MLGFIAGSGVCALGVVLLRVSARYALRKGAAGRAWTSLLIATQPLLLAALLIALAYWKPEQAITVAAGAAASYIGYTIHAVVRMKRRTRHDAAKGG